MVNMECVFPHILTTFHAVMPVPFVHHLADTLPIGLHKEVPKTLFAAKACLATAKGLPAKAAQVLSLTHPMREPFDVGFPASATHRFPRLRHFR